VQRPPHRLPDLLDAVGVAAGEQRRQVASDQRVHGGAAGAHGVRVPDALAAVGVAHADGDQLEAADGAVRAVGQRHRQRDTIVIGFQITDRHRRAVYRSLATPAIVLS
jgi:hypothetical protein